MGMDGPPPGEAPQGRQPESRVPPPPAPGSVFPAWEAQFTPQPATPPQPPLLPPPPLPPLPPDSTHWGFYQRLAFLRERARADAARGTTLTNVAAALTVGGGALGIVSWVVMVPMLLYTTVGMNNAAAGGSPDSDIGMILMLVLLIMVGLLLGASVFGYAIFVLTKASQLFIRTYQETSALLNERGLAVLVAQQYFIKQVQDLLAERAWIKLEGRSTYHRFEDYLDYCACHFPALRELAQGKRELNIWQLRREESLYKSRKWFSQTTWVYWTCGCLLIPGSVYGNIWSLVLLIYLIFGGRYIASRGVLVALCDYLLQPGTEEA